MIRSHNRKTLLKAFSYSILSICGITGISFALVKLNIYVNAHSETSPSESKTEEVTILREGDDVQQLFKAKVPIRDYSSKDTYGFEIVDTTWPHPFWQVAIVKNGFAYCNFGVGCPQDKGKTYKITGLRLPANANIPTGVELPAPVPGEAFYGPANHKRL